MSSFPAPVPPFIAARWSGGKQTPRLIVMHSTVSPTVNGGARAVARYFATTDRKASAHYIVDPGEVIQAVGDHTVAFHCGHNQDSIGVEFCDMPDQNVARWDAPAHRAMEDRAARLVAELCLAYNIRPYYVGAKGLRAGKKGVTTHANMSAAYRKSTHWDPGAWRRVRFMRAVRAHIKQIKAEGERVTSKKWPALPAVAKLTARQFVHVHHSSQFSQSPKSLRRAVRRYIKNGAHIITVTEVAPGPRRKALRRLAKRRGWGIVAAGKKPMANNAILWDKAVFSRMSGGVERVDESLRFTGPRGRTLPFGFAHYAILRHDKTRNYLAVWATHMPTKADSKGGWSANLDAVRDWRRYLAGWKKAANRLGREHRVDASILGTDSNLTWRRLWVRTMLKQRLPNWRSGYRRPFPKVGSHVGKRLIDWVLFKGSLKLHRATEVLPKDPSSDHKPIRTIFEWR